MEYEALVARGELEKHMAEPLSPKKILGHQDLWLDGADHWIDFGRVHYFHHDVWI